MNENTNAFVTYCNKNFNLKETVNYNYHSLPICLIDCIYSLRAKYFAVTVPIVERYAKRFMRGNKYAAGDRLDDVFNHIQSCGGVQAFVDNTLKNHQKLGANIPKEEVFLALTNRLLALNIHTIEDFQQFKDQELLEREIRSIRGMGDAGVNYLFMLAGDPNRCKPDVHIHHCITDACGHDVSNEECQIILTEAVSILKRSNSGLTVRQLDGIIWQNYQAK